MLKSLIPTLIISVLFAGLLPVSCAKSGGGGGGGSGTIATTPTASPVTTTSCNIPSGTCNTSYYNGISGLQIPGVQTSVSNYGYCGCTSGTYPIYNSSWGYACVPTSTFSNGYYYYGYYQGNSLTPQNYGSPGVIQQSYYNNPNPINGLGAGCYTSVAVACPLNTSNVCPGNATCVPVSNSQTLGICAQGMNGYGNTYSNGYNPYYGSIYGGFSFY
jgi:hypothetical protein